MRHLRSILVAALLVVVAAPASAAERAFVMRYQNDIESFDWNHANLWLNSAVLKNIMEGLFQMDASGKARPQLARSYSVSPDGRRYTIRLKPGVVWSDGRPLRAGDFVDSWRRLLAPESPSRGKIYFEDVENAAEFAAGRLKDFSKVGVRAVSADTIELRLRRRSACLLEGLAFWGAYPIRAELIEKYGAAWTAPGNLVVVGPYNVSAHESGRRILLMRNPRYHGPRARIATLNYLVVQNDDMALELFKKGELDNVWTGSSEVATGAVGHASFLHYTFPAALSLEFNQAAPPFDKVEARQAVAMAIDRARIAGSRQGNYQAANSLILDRLLKAGGGTALPFDPMRASQLWAGAGGSKVKSIELLVRLLDRNVAVAELVREELRRNLKIDVRLRYLPTRDFVNESEHLASAMTLVDSSDFSEPYTFLKGLAGRSPDERFARFLGEAAEAATPNGRDAAYRRALEVLLRDSAVVVPLFHFTYLVMLQPDVKNFVVTPTGDTYMRDVFFARSR